MSKYVDAFNPWILRTQVLNGYVEDSEGSLEWIEVTSVERVHTAALWEIDGIIFGRKAHALLAEFWPTAAETEGPPMTSSSRPD